MIPPKNASRRWFGGPVAGLFVRWASRLRFPALFGATSLLFLVNVFVPDVIPFADEILLGLGAVLLGSLRRPDAADSSQSR